MFSVSPSIDRTAVTLADALKRMGYYDGAKVGLVYANQGYYIGAAEAFKQAAAKYGVKPLDEERICMNCSTQDQAGEANNAVVKLRTKGVDHVVLLDGIVFSSYLQAEQAQSYFPRLAVTSNIVPDPLALNTSPTVLANAVGIGWTPAADMDGAHDGPENQTPQRKLCTQIIRDAGQDLTSPLAEINALYNCDVYFLMKAVVDKAGRADVGAMRGAVEQLGDSYAPTISWSSYFGPNRHDGVQTWRPLRFDLGCKCWVYAGGQAQFSHFAGQAK
jgi:ABC-type branched-subunit amino acid transport system substrate-binding protein